MEEEKNPALSPEDGASGSSKLNREASVPEGQGPDQAPVGPDTDVTGTGEQEPSPAETAWTPADRSGSAAARDIDPASAGAGAVSAAGAEPAEGPGAPAGDAGPVPMGEAGTLAGEGGTTAVEDAGAAHADSGAGAASGEGPGNPAGGTGPAAPEAPAAPPAGAGTAAPASAPDLENTLARVRPDAKKRAGKNCAASYQDKIRQHKRRRYRRNVALVVLVTLLLTAAVILWMCRGYTHAELKRIAVLTEEDSSNYANLGGNVVQYGTGGAQCIDHRGNTVWNVSYEMQQPIISISGNVIAIADRSGYDLCVMDQKGLRGTIRTSLPIHSIAAGENGSVAVIMNDSRTTWVRLYTAEGKEVAYIIRSMNENGYPIAAAVSPDGETLCLSSVQMSKASVKGNISFYNFGRAGRKTADHIVQHSDYIDEVIPYLHYVDSTTCVCISDARLYYCWTNYLRSPGSSSVPLPEHVQGVFTSESFTGILFTDTKGETQYRMDLYNKRGKQAGSIAFSIPYTDISISGDKVYIHNDQQCQIYTIGGRCLYDGTFGRTIRALIPGASLGDLLVVTAEEVDSVRLH